LIVALAAGRHVRDAAQLAGCSVSTAKRRLADPAFRAALDEAKADFRDALVARISQAALGAADTLRELTGPEYNPRVRLGAADSLLKHARETTADDLLTRQVAELKGLLHESRRAGEADSGRPEAVAEPPARSAAALGAYPAGPDTDSDAHGFDPRFLAEPTAFFDP
jgi:hypothetical protein